MTDPKHQSAHTPAAEKPKPKKSLEQKSANEADPTPGESIEGEGSPGLSILGGGGHA
jgi:hypothetical protein